jgi:hypothetical protein
MTGFFVLHFLVYFSEQGGLQLSFGIHFAADGS